MSDGSTTQPLTSETPPVQLAKLTDEKVGVGKEVEPPSTVKLRKTVATYLLILFIGTNVASLAAVVGLAYVDYCISSQLVERATTQPAAFEKLLASPEIIEKSRSVTSGVLMSLIGATTVQVGAGVYTITQYLFPAK